MATWTVATTADEEHDRNQQGHDDRDDHDHLQPAP
jgi:hypothetical protein